MDGKLFTMLVLDQNSFLLTGDDREPLMERCSVLLEVVSVGHTVKDGGRSSWWEIQEHSQQKQRPLGAAHLGDQDSVYQ